MFWSKTGREQRRQNVLDELLEIEPENRRSRLEEAVAAGDVRAAEVDQALRLVERLDALRVMSIPAFEGGLRSGSSDEIQTESVDTVGSKPSVSAGEPVGASGNGAVAGVRRGRQSARLGDAVKGKPSRHRPTGRRSSVAVVREPEAVPVESEPVDVMAVEVEGPDPVLPEPIVAFSFDPRVLESPMPLDAIEAATRLMARGLAARKERRSAGVVRHLGPRLVTVETQSIEPTLSLVGAGADDSDAPTIEWLRP